MVLLGVVFFGNLITLNASSLLRPHIRSSEGNDIIIRVFHHSAPVTMPVSFLLPVLIMMIYVVPFFSRSPGTGSPVSALARRRILSAPLSISLLSLIGWTLPIAGFFISSMFLGESLPPRYYLRVIMENLTNGLICFVICYNVLEIYFQRKVIPAAFPDNRLSEFKGIFSLSVHQRFQLMFFAISFFPVLTISLFTMAHLTDDGESELILPLLVIAFCLMAVSFVVNIMTARLFRQPLLAMNQLTKAVKKGDYSAETQVLSVDELGSLGEALNEMTAGLKEREMIRDTFGKMVDPRVRDHLLAGNVQMGGELCEATILFCDIRGFTPMSEKLSPGEVVQVLNEYFEEMSRCIEEAGGIVNKYIGDAVMALFGVPVPLENAAQSAMEAAFAMRTAREKLNERFREKGLPPIMSGVGLHSGEVLAGNIGSQSRMEYTVIGDTVNVAARIEKMCKKVKQDILLSEETVSRLKDDSLVKKMGSATLTGRKSRTLIYSVKKKNE